MFLFTCTCLFGLQTAFCESCTSAAFQGKSEHLLVQNKVEVKSTIAGRACTPAVLDLSRTAGHQGHHHDAHLHPEQDLPAAALRHHSELWRKHRPDSREGSKGLQTEAVVPVPLSQPTAAVSHAVQSDLQGSRTHLFGSVGHLTAEDACGQRRSEAGEPSSASHTLSCFRVTSAELDKGKIVVLCNHGLFKEKFGLWKTFYLLSNFCFTSLFDSAT